MGYLFAVLEIDFMGGFIDIETFFAAEKDGKAETLIEKYIGGFYSCNIYNNSLTFLMQYFAQGSVCTVHIGFGQFCNYLFGNCHQISFPSFPFLPPFLPAAVGPQVY